MAIKLKAKIALGGVFLFALLILVGAVSFYYLNRLSEESKAIVKANYETLNYSREMLNELDSLHKNKSDLERFEKNLQLQESNITEQGEKEMTTSLRKNFNTLKEKGANDSLQLLIRRDISQIMKVNLQAIDKKNQAAQQSAESAKTIITIILTVCILIGFTFILISSLVASPIAKLTKPSKQLLIKNMVNEFTWTGKTNLVTWQMLLIQWQKDLMNMNTAIFQRSYLKKKSRSCY
jgi:ABC-type antimicrobial peptide transport system permease subunit